MSPVLQTMFGDSIVTEASVNVPIWVLWGVGIAIALTFGLLIVASLFAMAFTAMSAGFLGGAEPWKEFGATFKAFLFYGLPTGLSASYVWVYANPWVGVLVGVSVFCTVWFIWARIEKMRRHRF